MNTDSPLMRHYKNLKEKYPEHIVLYRIGDFYEAFDQDAIKVSQALDIVLVTTIEGKTLAGFTHNQIDRYMDKLVKSGNKIAIVDQLC